MIRMNESKIILKNGEFGKIAVFMYSGTGDPQRELDCAISKYTDFRNNEEVRYIELIDSQLNNPWMRIIITGVNNMYQVDFDENLHHATDFSNVRDNTLNELVK
jgi:hypothetical protein